MCTFYDKKLIWQRNDELVPLGNDDCLLCSFSHFTFLLWQQAPVCIALSIVARSALSIPLKEAISFLNMPNPFWWSCGRSVAASILQCSSICNLHWPWCRCDSGYCGSWCVTEHLGWAVLHARHIWCLALHADLFTFKSRDSLIMCITLIPHSVQELNQIFTVNHLDRCSLILRTTEEQVMVNESLHFSATFLVCPCDGIELFPPSVLTGAGQQLFTKCVFSSQANSTLSGLSGLFTQLHICSWWVITCMKSGICSWEKLSLYVVNSVDCVSSCVWLMQHITPSRQCFTQINTEPVLVFSLFP